MAFARAGRPIHDDSGAATEGNAMDAGVQEFVIECVQIFEVGRGDTIEGEITAGKVGGSEAEGMAIREGSEERRRRGGVRRDLSDSTHYLHRVMVRYCCS